MTTLTKCAANGVDRYPNWSSKGRATYLWAAPTRENSFCVMFAPQARQAKNSEALGNASTTGVSGQSWDKMPPFALNTASFGAEFAVQESA